MTRRRRAFLCGAFGAMFLFLTGASAGLLRAAPPETTLVIVVAKDSKLDNIPFYDLKRLYLGDYLSGPGGERLIPLNQARNASVRERFERIVLGMDQAEVGRYWIDRKIRGQSGPPKAVVPLERLRTAVRRVDGTLTYLHASDDADGLKVVKVDGKSPGDAGYPLTY